MRTIASWALAVVVCLLASPRARGQEEYLDVLIVKVKPEKLADFEALTKKWADANRRFNGDHWLAMQTVYGEGNVYTFFSSRQNYADIDKLNEAEMQAAWKTFGKESTEKILRDFENCRDWWRTELRRRRLDLSRKPPTGLSSYAGLIGESKVLRTTAVHVRPGRVADFEALLKELKEAGEKNRDSPPVLVSQAVEGTKGTTFYLTTLRGSLAGFDKNPTIRELLGEEGYKKYLQATGEIVDQVESTLDRFSAELSNPPEEVAKAAADFWRPRRSIAAAAKPKQAAEPVAASDPGHPSPNRPSSEAGTPRRKPDVKPPTPPSREF
jgi:hypothetical protein